MQPSEKQPTIHPHESGFGAMQINTLQSRAELKYDLSKPAKQEATQKSPQSLFKPKGRTKAMGKSFTANMQDFEAVGESNFDFFAQKSETKNSEIK